MTITSKTISIRPPNFTAAAIKIVGTAPYCQHKFSQKALNTMRANQEAGSTARSKKAREAKDFDAVFQAATYRSREGWYGIPAPAFRNAMISACRTVGFKMTLAKLSLFVEADGFDAEDGTPLVRLAGEPVMDVRPARNATGVCDIRARPRFDEWSAVVRIRWDGDQFTPADVINLLARVGLQVGIGEGRADSRESAGIGWGHFAIADDALMMAAE